ncbi:MAG: site-specific DNA-methyltransferase [Pyrinomonadaceae bacterium]
MKKQKLELTWIGKDERPRLEPRILLEDKLKSYHAPHRFSDGDIFDNILIKGDNLLALKALEQEFTGKVKCVYIDPPYNTGSAFAHYDDGIEHSLWLSLIRDRLEILRKLLSEDGSIWITIDDDESHYLKVLCDEIFGRANFVSNVVWQKKASPQANAVWLSDSHDHILVYAKNKEIWRPNMLDRTEISDSRFTNPDNDPRGDWSSGDFTLSLTGGQRGAQFARTGVSANIYEIVTPSGRIVTPPSGRCWTYSKDKYLELAENNRVWFGLSGNNVPRLKRFRSEVQEGLVAMTVWLRTEVGDNQESKREMQQFNSQDIFATPKPERLMQRIIHLATNEGDLVLDSFGGSGTTGAGAHKMRRRWIMVELGEHCNTHIVPRLKKVVDGADAGGITKAVEWSGGGGFRFYELAPSLLKKDKWDNYIINPEYNAEMLAEAMCKHFGFTYAPSDSIYWMHGHSSENDFIYVTTQQLSREILQMISDEVGDERTLLICCKAFRAGENEFPSLTLKKIPNAVLGRCEWDRDDYSLQIQNLPMKEEEKGTQSGLPFAIE